jgi:hypothetical protein
VSFHCSTGCHFPIQPLDFAKGLNDHALCLLRTRLHTLRKAAVNEMAVEDNIFYLVPKLF